MAVVMRQENAVLRSRPAELTGLPVCGTGDGALRKRCGAQHDQRYGDRKCARCRAAGAFAGLIGELLLLLQLFT